MRVRFIVNPGAGKRKAEELTDAISRALSGAKGVFETRVASSKEDAFNLSKNAADKGYDSVFALGGDAMASRVASAIVNTPCVFGIIPGGNGCAFSKALGMPETLLDDALSVLLKGRIRHIDAGTVDGRFFFSTAGMALEVPLGGRCDDWETRRGMPFYGISALKEYMRFKSYHAAVKWDGGCANVFPLLLTIANTPTSGKSLLIAPDALPDDGLLDVCIAEKQGFLKTLFLAGNLLNGRINTSMYSRDFRTVRTKTLEVEREKAGLLRADGEVFEGGRTVTFAVLSKALKVWSF